MKKTIFKKWWFWTILATGIYILINIVAIGVSFYSPNRLHILSGIVDDKPVQRFICQISIACKVKRESSVFGDVIVDFKLKSCDDPTSKGACLKEAQRCVCLGSFLGN